LTQLSEACHGEGARLTVIFEMSLLNTEHKIIACTCCERADVDFVSTGRGYTTEDLMLLRKHLPDETGLQATAVATLDETLELQGLGIARIATIHTAAILDEWKRRESLSGPASGTSGA